MTNRAELTAQARRKIFSQAKIPSSLGILEEFAIALVKAQGTTGISISHPTLILCAADHGAASHRITLSNAGITHSQCVNFASGNGSCAVLCRENGIEMRILDMGVLEGFEPELGIIDRRCAAGTGDFTKGDAMTKPQMSKCLEAGAEAVKSLDKECNTVIFGDMGIGNSSSAIAVAAAITHKGLNRYFDCGSLDAGRIAISKYDILKAALDNYNGTTAEQAFLRFGGFEIGAIAGGMIEASRRNIAIVLDGLICISALLLASRLDPHVLESVIPAHKSASISYQRIAEDLGIRSPLDMGMSPGEGSGAAAAIPLLRESCALFSKLKSFGEARVNCAYRSFALSDFAIGATSYTIPADIVANARFICSEMHDKVQDMELVLFESEETSSFPDKESIIALADIAERNKMTYTVHLPYDLSLGSDSPAAVEQICNAVSLTRSLPVHAYILHLMPEDEKPFPARDIPAWQSRCKENVKRILQRTALPSRLLCVENLSYSFSYVTDIVEELDLGVAIDMGHLFKYDMYSTSLVARMLERARVVHMHGVDSAGHDHIGLDKLDKASLRLFLRDLKLYSRPRTLVLTMEVFSEDDLRSSLKTLMEELI